ncbi:unnamed protein product [Rotaria sp. Silwood2]|nr:unnamed protein product [Rotaria sp. Silwood2]CAF2770135.1 unnamed protein product [Rotaria sp. Silwood2]CAF3231183.1 unnamed protein product [Rotaria sp. Silwood2]CAF4031593.1 unnamed protein product [Rotaria sp. Silwood2]CAF4350890.1 unnamed protein product [Rotaria sp. Silwood2]
MFSKYLLICGIVLQIDCSFSAPIDGDRTTNEQRQKRQVENFYFPSLPKYNFNVPEQSRWPFPQQPKGMNGLRINPQYQFNDNFKFGPYVDYIPRQGFMGAGVNAKIRWKRSIDEDAQQSVN